MSQKNEMHLRYSETGEPGTFYLETDVWDMRYIFFCSGCGAEWRTKDWYSSLGDKPPDNMWFKCHRGRGCGFAGIVYFDKGENNDTRPELSL